MLDCVLVLFSLSNKRLLCFFFAKKKKKKKRKKEKKKKCGSGVFQNSQSCFSRDTKPALKKDACSFFSSTSLLPPRVLQMGPLLVKKDMALRGEPYLECSKATEPIHSERFAMAIFPAKFSGVVSLLSQYSLSCPQAEADTRWVPEGECGCPPKHVFIFLAKKRKCNLVFIPVLLLLAHI